MLPALRKLACQASAGVLRTSAVAICSNAATQDSIDELIKKDRLVLFMKGTPDAPRCGFSNAIVQILDFHGVKDYDSHDVLSDENLRQGIKDFSHWPTIPQVFIGGEFIGGCDIMLDMHRNGELIEELKRIGITSKLLVDEPQTKAG